MVRYHYKVRARRLPREQELVRRRFFASPETVVVGCHNSQSSKGVRLQIDDPTAITFNENFRVSFTERPAMFIAHMHTVDEGGDQFSQDLVISCELTKRTEVLAVGLIRRYLTDGLNYDDMASHAEAVSDRESRLLTHCIGYHGCAAARVACALRARIATGYIDRRRTTNIACVGQQPTGRSDFIQHVSCRRIAKCRLRKLRP